ncbi:MAG: hypothetical protein HYS16_01245 [Deltaproteobacteria bacterium]|nr:MAG: hypothetical protein HYS16_01245 [Deltaproteobacteria bacterium]
MYSTDTRSLVRKHIFIALKGKTNGHKFLAQALQLGSIAFLSEKKQQINNIIVVKNTLIAMIYTASNFIKQSINQRIAITGSNGKSCVKSLVFLILKNCSSIESVFAIPKNYNNYIGFSKSIYSISHKKKQAIFELGMNHTGEIKTLSTILNPTIASITSIGNAHSKNFSKYLDIIKAKMELFDSLPNKCIEIVNINSNTIKSRCKNNTNCKIFTFGKLPWVDIQYMHLNKLFIVIFQNKFSKINFPLNNIHIFENSINALSISLSIGIDFALASKCLEYALPIPGRIFPIFLYNNIIILDDSYNSSPESIRVGIKTLTFINAKRHILILGPIAESQPNYMKSIIESIQHSNIHISIFFNISLKNISSKIYSLNRVIWANNISTLARILPLLLKKKDVILLKGSRKYHIERVAYYLSKLYKQKY